jgi:hypothetical protein
MIAYLSGTSLFVNGLEITGPDLVHYLISGEPVPVFNERESVGELRQTGDQIQVITPDSLYQFPVKGLLNHVCKGSGPVQLEVIS